MVVRPPGFRQSKRPLRVAIGYVESKPAQAALDEIAEIERGGEAVLSVVSVVPRVSRYRCEKEMEREARIVPGMAAMHKAAERLHTAAPNAGGQLIQNATPVKAWSNLQKSTSLTLSSWTKGLATDCAGFFWAASHVLY